MANIILPRSELTPQLRADSIAAYNALRERLQVPPNAHYDFVKKHGEWGVEIWCGPRTAPTGGVAWVSCVDLCAAVSMPVLLGLQ